MTIYFWVVCFFDKCDIDAKILQTQKYLNSIKKLKAKFERSTQERSNKLVRDFLDYLLLRF